MRKHESRQRKGFLTRVGRLFWAFTSHLFHDRGALKEDARETGVILTTGGLIAAALDQSKFFEPGTLAGGLGLIVVGLTVWLWGHYSD